MDVMKAVCRNGSVATMTVARKTESGYMGQRDIESCTARIMTVMLPFLRGDIPDSRYIAMQSEITGVLRKYKESLKGDIR